jgi:hypothetical protein
MSEPSDIVTSNIECRLIYIIHSYLTNSGYSESLLTRKCSQVLASTRKSYSQVTRKSHASDSQILASPDLGANTRKWLASPWICEYACTQVYRKPLAGLSHMGNCSQQVYFVWILIRFRRVIMIGRVVNITQYICVNFHYLIPFYLNGHNVLREHW